MEAARHIRWLRVLLAAAFVLAAAAVVVARCSPNQEVRVAGKRLYRVRKFDRPARLLVLLALAQAMLWPGLRRRGARGLDRVGKLCGKRWTAPAITAALVAIFVWAKINQHRAFGTHAGDFALLDHAIANTLRGDPFFAPVLRRHYFSQNVVPLFYALAPLYRIWDSPYVLLALQGAGVALAFAPLWLLIRRRFPEPHAPVLLALSWLTCKPMMQGFFYDFHPEMLEPATLFAAFWLLDRIVGNGPAAARWFDYAGFFACVLAAFSLKSDMPLYAFGLAVSVAIFHRRWSFAAALGALCIVCAYLMVVAAPRHFAAEYGGGLQFIERYADYGSTPAEIAKTMLLKPWRVVADLAGSGFPKLLGVALFLPLLAPLRLLVLGVLPVLPCAMSNWESQADLGLYWGVPGLIYLIFVALAGLDNLCRRFPEHRPRILWAACLLVAAVDLGHWQFYRVEPRHVIGRRIAASLPAAASVAAQYDLMPHVPRRAKGYTRKLYVLKPGAAALAPDYAFFDTTGSIFPLSARRERKQYEAMLKRFETSPHYECVADVAGYKLFRRRQSAPSRPLPP